MMKPFKKTDEQPITCASIHVIKDGIWVRSEFPHPLVTLDFDMNDHLVAVTVAGKSLEVSTYRFNQHLNPEDPIVGRLAKARCEADKEKKK